MCKTKKVDQQTGNRVKETNSLTTNPINVDERSSGFHLFEVHVPTFGLNLMVILGVIVAGLLAFLVYRYVRKQRRQSRLLQQAIGGNAYAAAAYRGFPASPPAYPGSPPAYPGLGWPPAPARAPMGISVTPREFLELQGFDRDRFDSLRDRFEDVSSGTSTLARAAREPAAPTSTVATRHRTAADIMEQAGPSVNGTE